MRGFAAVSTVILLSAIVITVVSTITLLSIGEAQSALALMKGDDQLAFVEGCVEDALLKSRASVAFGDTNPILITRPEGTCTVTVNKTQVPWVMTVTTNASNPAYKRTIEVQYTRNPSGLTLGSWKEI